MLLNKYNRSILTIVLGVLLASVIGIILILFMHRSDSRNRLRLAALRNSNIEELATGLAKAADTGFQNYIIQPPESSTVRLPFVHKGAEYVSTPKPSSLSYVNQDGINRLLEDMRRDMAMQADEYILINRLLCFANAPAPYVIENPVIDTSRLAVWLSGSESSSEWMSQICDRSPPIVVQPMIEALGVADFTGDWLVTTNRRIVLFNIRCIVHNGKAQWSSEMTTFYDYSDSGKETEEGEEREEKGSRTFTTPTED